MGNEHFFDKMLEQSYVKTRIVYKYYDACTDIMKSKSKIAYIDLFSGPGSYKDKTESIPMLVLKKAVQNHALRSKLVTIFTDANEKHVISLQTAVENLSEIDTLKYKPLINKYSVNEKIVEQFENTSVIPTLLFADPWGYKGLSLRLIKSFIKDWGCDCIFFFNYERINRSISIKISFCKSKKSENKSLFNFY